MCCGSLWMDRCSDSCICHLTDRTLHAHTQHCSPAWQSVVQWSSQTYRSEAPVGREHWTLNRVANNQRIPKPAPTLSTCSRPLCCTCSRPLCCTCSRHCLHVAGHCLHVAGHCVVHVAGHCLHVAGHCVVHVGPLCCTCSRPLCCTCSRPLSTCSRPLSTCSRPLCCTCSRPLSTCSRPLYM